jgi:hypothetical protein
MPRVRVPQHVARLVTRFVVDYFAYAARPRASARRAARHPARRQLLHLHHVSGCFGTSRGLSRDSSLTTSPLSRRLVVDYFAYAARPGASARRAARHAGRRRLLRLRRASACLGTSRSSSPGLSATTSPTPCVRLLRHVARLVA